MTQACNGAPNIYPDEALAPGDITTLPGPVTYGAPTQTGCTIALGSAKLIKSGAGAGQFFQANGAIHPVTVVDARANDPGWVSAGSVTQFDRQGGGPVAHFSGNDLGWNPSSTDTGPLSSDDGTYDQLVVSGALVAPKVTGAGMGRGSRAHDHARHPCHRRSRQRSGHRPAGCVAVALDSDQRANR